MSAAVPLAEAFIRIRPDNTSFVPELSHSVDKGMSQAGVRGAHVFSDSLRKHARTALVGAGTALGLGVLGGVTAVLKTGYGEVTNYQKGLAQLTQGLKTTHGAAGLTADQMENLASKIQDYSGQTDDSVVAAEQLLITFTNIRNEAGKGNDVFTRTTKIAADMAARLGGDASTSAIQLGKALNDPVKGVTALSRVGVSFDKQQTKAIATAVKHHNVLKAQKIILAELTKEFGGSARAVGNTLPGQVEKSKRKFEDLSQQVVTKMLPALNQFVGYINDRVLPAATKLFNWFDAHKDTLVPIVEKVGLLAAGLWSAHKALSAINSTKSVISGLGGLLGKGPVGGGGPLGGLSSKTPLPVYVTNLVGGGLPGVGGGPGGGGLPGERSGKLGKLGRGLGILSTVGAAVAVEHVPSAKSLEPAFKKFGVSAGLLPDPKKIKEVNAQTAVWNKLLIVNTGLAAAAAKAHKGAVQTVLAGLRGIPGAIAQAKRQANQGGQTIGQALDDGITIGIRQGSGKISLVSTQVVGDALVRMHRTAQLGSPSKITTRYGRWISEGLAIGLAAGKPAAVQKAADLVDAVKTKLADLRSLAAGLRSSIADSIVGNAQLTNTPNQTVGGITKFLQHQVTIDRQFRANLARLAARHLSPQLVAQLAQAGPEAGGNIARQLVGATGAQLARINRLQTQIGKVADATGQIAANDLYGHQLAALVHELQGLRRDVKNLVPAHHHAQAAGGTHSSKQGARR